MGDGDIIKLGADADLQIQHNGSNSIIRDNGTGSLDLQVSNFAIVNTASDEFLAKGTADGAFELYHNGGKKIETTATGITVSGNADAVAFTGDYGTSFGILGSSAIGDSNIPYNSFGAPNSTYYRWVLPKAGTYLLSSNIRINLYGVTGYIKARLYNNTTSTAIDGGNLTGTTLGATDHVRMLFEEGTASGKNVNITANYMITTSADNQDIHHQMFTTNNSTSSSVQSDANGRSIHYWQRIG
tara:strand:- start:253 stop:978 length:726 start_codon:yes stop_codon:yes gene_type:complete